MHFTEQIRLFHVGGSVECAAFCALVPARNRKVPLLCPIASTSNAEDEIYNTAQRDKCMLLLIQLFILSPNMDQKYLPLCDVVSVSLWQHFSPEILSRRFVSSACIFKRKHCFHFFITAPPVLLWKIGVHPELFLELHYGFSFYHINAFSLSFFVFASHLLHKIKKKKKIALKDFRILSG